MTQFMFSGQKIGGAWNGLGVNVAYLPGSPQPMTIRASGNEVHLVWVNWENGISPRYSRSTDQGSIWSNEIDIAEDSLGAQMVYIAVQDSHVVVCWMGYEDSPYMFTGDIFIRQSFDSGETWNEEQQLTELHKAKRCFLYVEDSLIVVSWMDQRFETSGDEVMVRYSFDYGINWMDEERLSFGENHSYEPIPSKTGDRIHIIWGDIRPEAPGLYYCANNLTTSIDNEISVPERMDIEAYPNPFNSSTKITYTGLKGGEIEIYDITGRLVKVVPITNSIGAVNWDATDQSNKVVSSGLYFIRAQTSEGYTSKKVIYLR